MRRENAGGLYPAQSIGKQQQQEQRDRESDAKSQSRYHPIGAALVFHHENQRKSKAAQYENESDGNEYFHDVRTPSRLQECGE